MKWPPKESLVWRFYALGLLQITVVIMAAIMLPRIVLGPPHGPGHSGGPPQRATAHPPPPPGPPPSREPELEPRRGPDFPAGRDAGLATRRGRLLLPLLTFGWGLLIVVLGGLLTARWIIGPLKELSESARAFGAGNLRTRVATRRKDELGEVGSAFDEMAGRIEKLLYAERELLANVSHELRTPLARIRVALDIATEGNVEAVKPSLAEIATDLSELEALLDDILTVRRMEMSDVTTTAGGFVLDRRETSPESLCVEAAARLRARHPKRSLALEVAGDLPPIQVDTVLLRRVLDNLLENAAKYSPDASTSIALRAVSEGSSVVFEVTDDGVGIAEEDLPHLFTPFFRGERSRSRGTGGVGLGLALAKRIVEAHGGTIAVTSQTGVGTTVRVAIPVGANRATGKS